MKKTIDILIDIYKKYGYMFQGTLFSLVVLTYKEMRATNSFAKSFKQVCKHLKDIKVYKGKYASAFKQMACEVQIDTLDCENLIYSWDIYKSIKLNGRAFGNCTIDYSKILENGLECLRIKGNDEFALTCNSILDGMYIYLSRLEDEVDKSDILNKESICAYLSRFKDKPAISLEEALQRILLINQLQWQTGHVLVGLGRLDYILNRFDEDDERAYALFREFFLLLHKYYSIKSNALMGDTGQIIILGGCDREGKCFQGRYTDMIANIVAELRLPDPKILIRVTENSIFEWDRISDQMLMNSGSMLISNDDIVIKNMTEFGYDIEDARDYITSACWEPISAGCFEQNNILSLNFLEPFEKISKKFRHGYKSLVTYEDFINAYLLCLEDYASDIAKELRKLKWTADPLYSMFDEQARLNHSYIGEGGSKYNNIGILSVALGNAINAIINIKRLVFDEEKYTYGQLDKIRRKNYKGYDDVRTELLSVADSWGHDDPYVIKLANELTGRVIRVLTDYKMPFGGSIKMGFSSPHYIMDSKDYPASFDGRRRGDPFCIHISAGRGSAYTELFNLAAKLDYSLGRFNGDVADIIISPSFMRQHKKVFARMFRTAFSEGVCQLQVNMLDSRTLIAAKENPSAFPDLIVRVWGFNSYFNELPDEYKDYLIERTRISEFALNRNSEIQLA